MGKLRPYRCIVISVLAVLVTVSLSVVLLPERVLGGELGGYMRGDLIYDSTRSLSGGLGVGDLDGDGTVEIAVCDFEGNVVMLEELSDGSFRAGKIWQESGQPGTDRGLFDLVITDVLDDKVGPEILVGGYSGSLYAIYKDGDEWSSTVLVESPFRIFDLELGDIDPAPGIEILYGSMQNDQQDPDRFLRYIRRTGSGTYEQVEIPVPEAVKAITVADADPDIEGEEIWITTSAWNDKGGTTSSLVEVWNDNGTWKNRVLFTDPDNLLTNVRVGDLWSGNEGNEMIITSLSGWCYLGYFEGGSLKVEPIFQARTETGSSFGLEGLALGDINPGHDGDEALVTGYYNRVYQVVEVAGEVISDLVWQKESSDIKLELSGVEIADVTDRYPGNEGLVASLQGWMEMLSYEQDGLSLSVPTQRFRLIEGGEVRVPVNVIPSGLLKGPLTIEVDSDPSVIAISPSGLVMEDHDPFTIEIVLEAKGPLTARELDLRLEVRVGTYAATGTIMLKLEGSGTATSLFTEPASGIVYTTMGSHLRVRVGVLGGENYDHLDLSVNEAEGLAASVNTPLIPGEDEYLTVLPLKGAEPGVRSLTVTASYEGVAVSEAEFVVEVRALSDDLHAGVAKVADDHYKAWLVYNGSVQVNHVSIEFVFGARTVGPFPDEMLVPGYNRSIDIYLNKGESGVLTLFVEDIALEEIKTINMGLIGQPSREDGELDWFWVVAGILLVLIAIVFIGVVFLYSKGTSDSDARIDRIGDFDRRGARPSQARSGPSVPGRHLGGPYKGSPRKASPPPFGTLRKGPGRR